VGGLGDLKIKFTGNVNSKFKVPYLLKDFFGKYSLGFFQLNNEQKGEILVSGFSTKIGSAIIIPSVQNKTSGFTNPEPTFPFFWEASTIIPENETTSSDTSTNTGNSKYLDKPISQMTKEEIKNNISEIEKALNQLKDQLAKIENGNFNTTTCNKFSRDLFYGLTNDKDVICLQEFLKSQGSEIYPEGLVTGNFLSLTQKALIRFQEKYATDILIPLKLEKGTGFFGSFTRNIINKMLNKIE
jgi:hypothetical protein